VSFLIEENNLLRVSLRGSIYGVPIWTQLEYVAAVVEGLGQDSGGVIDGIMEVWSASFPAVLPDEFSLRGVWLGKITGLTAVAGPPARLELGFGQQDEVSLLEFIPGTYESTNLPLQVTAKVHKIGTGGLDTFYWQPPDSVPVVPDPVPVERRFAGRVSHGPLVFAQLHAGSTNRLTNAAKEQLEGCYRAMTLINVGEGADTVQLSMVNLSRVKSGAVRADATDDPILAFQIVSDVNVGEFVGTQDRRTR